MSHESTITGKDHSSTPSSSSRATDFGPAASRFPATARFVPTEDGSLGCNLRPAESTTHRGPGGIWNAGA